MFTQLISLLSAKHGRHCTRCQAYRTQRIHALWSFLLVMESDESMGKLVMRALKETNKRLR